MPGDSASRLLGLLHELHASASDPNMFFALKRQILEEQLDQVPEAARADLVSLQNTVDSLVAVAGTPMSALGILVEEIQGRLELLTHLQQMALSLLPELTAYPDRSEGQVLEKRPNGASDFTP